MKVIEIAFAGYPVKDVKQARRFYEETLGLQPSSVYEGEQMAWIEYDIGPGTLAIGKGMQGWNPSADGGAVALEVDDFEGAVGRLREHGVQFRFVPEETPVCHMAVIADPDGNSVLIHKRKPANGG